MSDNERTKSGWGILIIACSVVILLWTLNWVLLGFFGGGSDKQGQFGDMFGAVNALYSGLAFAFLIYTIWLQREELKLQREELKLQREALELQAKELKRQADELEKTGNIQKSTYDLQKQHLELTHLQIDKDQERRIKANFILFGDIDTYIFNQNFNLKMSLQNVGVKASNVKFETNPKLEFLTFGSQNRDVNKTIAQMKPETIIKLIWIFDSIENTPESINVHIKYNDIEANEQVQTLQIVKDNDINDNLSEKFKIVYLDKK